MLYAHILYNLYSAVIIQQAERRMIGWMSGVKVTDRFLSSELRKRLGIDGVIAVLQQNTLIRYERVLRKDENDWVRIWGS